MNMVIVLTKEFNRMRLNIFFNLCPYSNLSSFRFLNTPLGSIAMAFEDKSLKIINNIIKMLHKGFISSEL